MCQRKNKDHRVITLQGSNNTQKYKPYIRNLTITVGYLIQRLMKILNTNPTLISFNSHCIKTYTVSTSTLLEHHAVSKNHTL